MRFGILGALFGVWQSSVETVTNVRFLRDGRPPLECRTAACGRSRFPRHLRGACCGDFSALLGRIVGILGAHNPICSCTKIQ